MKTLRNKIGICVCHALFCAVVGLLLRAIPANAQTVSTLAGRGFFADGAGSLARFRSPTGVSVDGVGNVYVADQDNHRIRKVTSSGVVSTIAGNGYSGYADGIGSVAQFYSPTGIAVDGEGNVYVADQGNHRIRKITTSGVVSTLAGSGKAGYADGAGINAQFNAPFGIAVDGGGNVFVADQGNHRIRKITPSGLVSTLAGSGSPGYINGTGVAAQFLNPRGIAVDWSGNAYVADCDNHRIRKITSAGVVSTFAGNGNPGFADGAGTTAQFKSPYGVIVDWTDNVYIADANNNRIRKIAPSGLVSTLAGSGVPGYDAGTAGMARFNYPLSVAVDGVGNIYVADANNNRIRKIVLSGEVTSIAGSDISGYTDGAGNIAQFSYPFGIALDGAGNAYVADQGNSRIRKITLAGLVSTFAGRGINGYVDATADIAQFNSPFGVASDGAGNLYVADVGNHCIRRITLSGVVSTLAGSGISGYVDGVGSMAKFDNPYGIAVDKSGNIYVADSYNERIRKITSSGIVTTFAGSGSDGYADGAGTTAQFSFPNGIAVDGDGNVFVADRGNNRIRKITSLGRVTTFAGSGDRGYADGIGVTARFNNPTGIAVDDVGNVYVADQGNFCIRKITSLGVVTTFAGNGIRGYADGAGVMAQFAAPSCVAVDALGNVYLTDAGSSCIRKITPAAPVSVKFTSSNIAPTPSIAIAPHPVQDEANLTFTLSTAARVDVLLFDVLGRLVREETLGVLPEGTHEWALGMNAFPYGTYTVIVRAGTEQRTKLLQHIR